MEKHVHVLIEIPSKINILNFIIEYYADTKGKIRKYITYINKMH